MTHSVLLITCGALAREMVELVRSNHWSHVKIKCLPANLHHTPARIPKAVEDMIESNKDRYRNIFIGYADCGTGGELDDVAERHGVERLAGAHCYEFLAGSSVFANLSDEEPGTFYLTDFLVRHFDRFVKAGLGIDRHPELLPMYFGNYKRVVYLTQNPTEKLRDMARTQAEYLGLDYEERATGMEPLSKMMTEQAVQWRN